MANSAETVAGEATLLYFAPRYLMTTSRPSAIAFKSELTVVTNLAHVSHQLRNNPYRNI